MYSVNIPLTRDFLIRTHSHPLLSPIKDLPMEAYEAAWANEPEEVGIRFSGKYDCQFNEEAEYLSFSQAFSTMLKRHKLDIIHQYPLYYFITFYSQDTTKQSIKRNLHNSLLMEARFILELIEDSYSYIDQLHKDKSYQCVVNSETLELMFVKQVILKQHPDFNVEFASSYAKQPEDVITLKRLVLYNTSVYLRPQYNFSFRRNVKTRTAKGKEITEIDVPGFLKQGLFFTLIDDILKSQEAHNSVFYRELSQEGGFDFKNINQFYETNLKHNHSHSTALRNIGLAISDYLKKHTQLKTKRAIANFLFEYFALFKAYQLKTSYPIPEEYSDLTAFYIRQNITPETVRLMFKQPKAEGGEI